MTHLQRGSSSGRIVVIEGDLRVLSLESRGRHPNVKEAAERAILWARSHNTTSSDDATTLLAPVLLALRTNYNPLVLAALSALQKLLVHGVLPHEQDMSDIVIHLNATAKSSKNDQTQLKLLQTVVALFSTSLLHGDALAQSLTLPLVLLDHGNVSSAVASTAAACVRQGVTMLLDRTSAAWKAGSETYAALEQDSLSMLRDLALLGSGEGPTWLKAPSLDMCLALELLDYCLANNSKLFLESDPFCALLRDAVCPLVHMCLQMQSQFRPLLRLMRIVEAVVVNYMEMLSSESEILISKLTRFLEEPKTPDWMQITVLESLSDMLSVPALLVQMTDLGQDGKLFSSVIANLGTYAQRMASWKTSDLVMVPSRLKVIDMLSTKSPPKILKRDKATLVSKCAANFIKALDSMEESHEKIAIMATQAWPPILGTLSLFLSQSTDPPLLREVVSTIATFIGVCCKLPEQIGATPRDAFVASLVKPAAMDERSIICASGVLQIVHSQQCLNSSAWSELLQCLLRLHPLLFAAGDPLTPGKATLLLNDESPFERGGNALPKDFVRVGIIQLWKATRTMSDDQLCTYVASLIELSDRSLEDSQLSTYQKTWAFHRLCEALLANFGRTSAAWALAQVHFVRASSCPSSIVRGDAVVSISSLARIALEKGGAAERTHALQTLVSLSLSEHSGVRRSALSAVHAVLGVAGHVLGDGWVIILQVLDNICGAGFGSEIAEGFSCLKMSIDNFLPAMQEATVLGKCISVVCSYALQAVDSNASLTSGSFFWSLAHHVSSLPLESQSLWTNIFAAITQLCEDETRSEIRAGGIRTLFKMLDMYSEKQPRTVRACLLTECVGPMAAKLAARAVIAWERIEDSPAWAETVKMALQGLPPLLSASLSSQDVDYTALTSVWGSALSLCESGLKCPHHTDLLLSGDNKPLLLSKPLREMERAALSALTELGDLSDAAPGGGRALLWGTLRRAGAFLVSESAAEGLSILKLRDERGAAAVTKSSTARFNAYYTLCDLIRHVLIPILSSSGTNGDHDAVVLVILEAVLQNGQILLSKDLFGSSGVFYDSSFSRDPYSAPLLQLVQQTYTELGARDLTSCVLAGCKLASLGVAGLGNVKWQPIPDSEGSLGVASDALRTAPLVVALTGASAVGLELLTSSLVKCQDASLLPPAIAVIGAAMMTRGSNGEDPLNLWLRGVGALITLSRDVALSAIKSHRWKRETTPLLIWTDLLDVIEQFLLNGTASSPDESEIVAAADKDLLTLLTYWVLRQESSLAERIVATLSQGSRLAPTVSRPALPAMCARALFQLCDAAVHSVRIPPASPLAYAESRSGQNVQEDQVLPSEELNAPSADVVESVMPGLLSHCKSVLQDATKVSECSTLLKAMIEMKLSPLTPKGTLLQAQDTPGLQHTRILAAQILRIVGEEIGLIGNEPSK